MPNDELPGITALAEIFPLNLVFTARTRDGKTASISVPVVMGG